MTPDDMKKRTRVFALEVIMLAESLPNTSFGRIVQNQLIRCGTSVASNYRAACRAKSRRDFLSKMGTVEEETDESAFWIELLVLKGTVSKERVQSLLTEADEILSIVVSSVKTARL